MTTLWKTLGGYRALREFTIAVAGSKDGAQVLVVLCLSSHIAFVAAATLRLMQKQNHAAVWIEILCAAFALAVFDGLMAWKAVRRLGKKNA